jgi:YHS domain-containing protein
MIKLILFLLIGYVALKSLKTIFGSGAQTRMAGGRGRASAQIDDLMVQDLNCQTYIPKRDAVLVEQGGQTYYFCSPECRDAYLANL